MTIWMNARAAHRSGRRRGTTRAVVLVALVAGAMATAAPAQARPIERGRYHDTIEKEFTDFCGVSGLSVTDRGAVTVNYVLNAHGPDGFAYFHESAREDRIVTDVATGTWVRIVSVSSGKDLHVDSNGDGTLTVTAFGTGNAVMYDETGEVIARNPGQIRTQFLLDDGGTLTDPSDDEFLEFLGVLLGSTGRNDDFCEATLEAFGR